MAWGEGDRYKDPYDYEKKTAKKLGGRRSIASGAFFGDMDVNSSNLTIDNKRTEAKTYKFDPKDFDKVEEHARKNDKMPSMFINFHTLGKSYAIVRERDLLAILEELEYYEGFYKEKVNGF